MSDREFIHSTADVVSTLEFAVKHGLQVRLDEPQPDSRVRMLAADEISATKRGVFFLFRPEWVFGPWQTMQILTGHNAGKYFTSPNVNCSAITVSFHGEWMDQERRRFGGCVVSWHSKWLEMPAKRLWEAPPEVSHWWKQLVAHLSSGLVVKVGVHSYHICKGVAADSEGPLCLPPFDFIPWGPDVFK